MHEKSEQKIVDQLNINFIIEYFIRNEFDFLAHQVKGNICVLLISEAKLDESFPVGQFLMDGYSVSFCFNRDGNGCGILLYITKDIPSKLLSVIRGFFVEMNLCNKKK